MLAIDTEDNSEGTPHIINFFDGAFHHTFTGSDCRVKAWDWLCKTYEKREICWAVNAEYDLINLFGAEWLGRIITLQYVSSGLMRGLYKEAPITFLDTFRHWPMSVEQMGKHIGLPKLEKDFTSVVYCQRDTEITYLFAEKMLELYDELDLTLKSTLPSMALQLFLQTYEYEPPTFIPDVKETFRKAYYGGRVEVFRLGKIKSHTLHYDVNSLFPSVMFDLEFPRLDSWLKVSKPNFDFEGVCDCYVYVPDMDIPPLPFRDNEEIIYPVGSFQGCWTYAELRQLLKDGGRITHVNNAIEFSKTERPFRKYVEFCYNRRLQAVKGTLEDVLWKLFMNSLYGKFGQNRGLTTIYWDKKKKEVCEKELSSDSKFSNVIWSAYVTSYARLRLLEYLRGCSQVYYTDTDSVFTPDKLETSTDLGKLKLEGEYEETEFLGNKLYLLDNKKAVAKGVPRGSAMDFIRTGRAVFRRPARFRESRKSLGLKANVWYEDEKRLEKIYQKRKVTANGWTEPWDYNDWLRYKERL